jgi:tetratricopeptide (TPR) repeat protein
MELIRVGVWPTLGPPHWELHPLPGLRVGRDPRCELRLDDPAVSPFHLTVSYENGELWVRDLDSLNGTGLDGQKLRTAVLQPGSELRLGGYVLNFGCEQMAKLNPHDLCVMLEGLLADGRFELCAQAGQAAVEEFPDSAGLLGVLAQAMLKTGQDKKAQDLAIKAEAIDPLSPQALAARAMWAERHETLERAREYWQRLLDLNLGQRRAARHLRKLEKLQKVYAKMRQMVPRNQDGSPALPDNEIEIQSGNLNIRYLAQSQRDLVMPCIGTLTSVGEEVKRSLGFEPESYTVNLAGGAEALEKAGDWAAACYLAGKAEILINPQVLADKELDFYFVALAHEYVHLAVDRMSGGTAPQWLDEGLAQTLTQNQTESDRALLEKALSADALLPLSVLTQNFAQLVDKALIDLAYAQSYSMVEYLLERIGWDGVRQLLEGMRGEACPMGYLEELNHLEEGWLAWLKFQH